MARLGGHDVNVRTEQYPHEDHSISRAILHENFSIGGDFPAKSDIALLELTVPVVLKEHIAPICLPKSGTDFSGEIATVSGWGLADSDKLSESALSLLQETDVEVVEDDVCHAWLAAIGNLKSIPYYPLCAGFTKRAKGPCAGDSGGPLIVRKNGRAQLIGIVSWGFKCGAPFHAAMYTNVSRYTNWIIDNMDA